MTQIISLTCVQGWSDLPEWQEARFGSLWGSCRGERSEIILTVSVLGYRRAREHQCTLRGCCV